VTSGDPISTTFGNSLRVAAFILTAAELAQCEYWTDFVFFVAGDDQLICCKTQSIMERMGKGML
jgi:hypothetical protein